MECTHSLLTILFSVELLIFIFCFNDFTLMIPYTIDMSPPVCPLVLSCISYNESIQVNTQEKFISLITRLNSIIFVTNTKPLFRFFKSYSSILETRVHRKDTNVSGSGRTIFIRKNKLAITV